MMDAFQWKKIEELSQLVMVPRVDKETMREENKGKTTNASTIWAYRNIYRRIHSADVESFETSAKSHNIGSLRGY